MENLIEIGGSHSARSKASREVIRDSLFRNRSTTVTRLGRCLC